MIGTKDMTLEETREQQKALYHVVGDLETPDEKGRIVITLLHQSDTLSGAKGWIVRYVKNGEMGGYDTIDVLEPEDAQGYRYHRCQFERDYGWNHY